ncbi:Imm8 family immunity protein [Microscilla marina]|uniref:Immunity protein 8 n=1 Tax=Microscilla marina ATCC 23134 TaxID=313606 RepID=A1ZK11_MICM2|nr:Imm8 family immunity protein [Microscilla marina]EAY29464.1 conserved hypothetical protein [Microscilla marina ATCC 23134]
MKAKIIDYHSPDIDLTTYKPSIENEFCFALQVFVGEQGSDTGFESFCMTVCTPRWLEKTQNTGDIIFGEHYLIVFEYNLDKIINTITEYIDSIEEDSWDEIGKKIDRIGLWEFRDYVEHK